MTIVSASPPEHDIDISETDSETVSEKPEERFLGFRSVEEALEQPTTFSGRPIAEHETAIDLASEYAASVMSIREGDIIEGEVMRIDEDEVLLDVGFKSEGVIFARELSVNQRISTHEAVTMGETVEAYVLRSEDSEGRLLLSKKRAEHERSWNKIVEIKNEGKTLTAPVVEAVKGGLILDIGVRGFLPASLIDSRRVDNLESYVGQILETQVLEMDRARNSVVLSRKDMLQESRRAEREKFLATTSPGDFKEGEIISMAHFGVFVDLGGMDGLVHISEMSWKHIHHPSDIVKIGDKVKVQILDIDAESDRVALSMKSTQRDPWEEFAETHNVGELIYGKVTKIVAFGAFVQINDVIEGLIHISELADIHIEKAGEAVKPGEEMWVKILDIDLQRRRVSLSLRQVADGGVVAAEYQEAYGDHAYDYDGNYIGPDYAAEA